MKKIVAFILSIVMVFSSLSVSCFAVAPDEYDFYDVGTTKLEYAVYGKENEQTLVAFAGNNGDVHEFEYSIIPEMSKHYKVIVMSTRGTGETQLGTDRLTFELEAEDAAKLLDYLGVETAYVYGFSDGGNLGLVFTLMYPERVTKLCVQSPNINIFGTKFLSQIVFIYKYVLWSIEYAFTKDPETLRRKEIKGMMAYQPTLSFKDLEKINIPVLHIYAENDLMYRWHSEKISKHIPNCKSIMVEGADHTGAFSRLDTFLNPALLDFFG